MTLRLCGTWNKKDPKKYLLVVNLEHDLLQKSTLGSDDELVAEQGPVFANELQVNEGVPFAQLPENLKTTSERLLASKACGHRLSSLEMTCILNREKGSLN